MCHLEGEQRPTCGCTFYDTPPRFCDNFKQAHPDEMGGWAKGWEEDWQAIMVMETWREDCWHPFGDDFDLLGICRIITLKKHAEDNFPLVECNNKKVDTPGIATRCPYHLGLWEDWKKRNWGDEKKMFTSFDEKWREGSKEFYTWQAQKKKAKKQYEKEEERKRIAKVEERMKIAKEEERNRIAKEKRDMKEQKAAMK